MMIEIENLKKTYSNKTVLDIHSLRITKGEKVAITGQNGSGKTTLLQLVLDLVEPDAGNVLLFGNNVRIDEKWKERTASFLNDSFLLDFLTVREYIHFLAPNASLEQIDETLASLNFTTLNLNERIRNLSSGNKKKVGILGALLNPKDIIVFDEVCNFLDYESRKGLTSYLKSLTDCTILVAEHNREFIEDFASRVLVLDNGVVIKDAKVEGTMRPKSETNTPTA